MKLTVIAIVAVILLFVTFNIIGLMPNYSDGQRTGDVYKFSYKGIFYKSWEGEMYLGGVNTDNSNGNLELDKFYFSIPADQVNAKKDLIEKLQKCAKERLTCTIHYNQWLFSPIYQDSEYTVEGVELPIN